MVLYTYTHTYNKRYNIFYFAVFISVLSLQLFILSLLLYLNKQKYINGLLDHSLTLLGRLFLPVLNCVGFFLLFFFVFLFFFFLFHLYLSLMDNINSANAIVLGCTVGVLTLATQSVGLTLQRRSHIQEDEKPPEIPRKPAYKRHMWQVGLLLFLFSNVVGSSVQITTLPLVILSPLQAVGLVFNSICSSLLLDEPFTQYAAIGTILVATGALAVAFFGVVPEPHHNLAELLILLHRKPFIIWMICTFIVIVGILVLLQISKSWKPSIAHPDRLPLLRGMMYGVICGILSAHSLLMAKSAVEIIVRGLTDHWMDLKHYQSWVIVGFFLFFAISQLYFLNCALHLCSTSVIYPLNFCIYNIVTILNGLIYFEQVSKLSVLNCWLVALGTLLILLGVLCLSWRLGLNDDLGLPHHHHPYSEIEHGSLNSDTQYTVLNTPQHNYGSFESSDGMNTMMVQKNSDYQPLSGHPGTTATIVDDTLDQQTITGGSSIDSSTSSPPDKKYTLEPVSPFTAAATRNRGASTGVPTMLKKTKFFPDSPS